MEQDIAFRYALALFQAVQENKRKAILESFEQISLLNKKTSILRTFLMFPEVKDTSKQKVLAKVFEAFDPALVRFLLLLLKKKRFVLLPKIISEYKKIYFLESGTTYAKLFSATPLADEDKKTLQDKFERLYDKKISFHYQVDPRVIGGLVLIMSNQLVDLSIKGKLDKLKEKLLMVKV